MFNVFMLLIWEQINRTPFEDMKDAIDFARQQTDDLTYVVKGNNSGQIIVKNGEVTRIQKHNVPCTYCKKSVECMPNEAGALCDGCVPF